ncbi:Poly [ADP-ribose] polymerase [Echinococcus granulosus]|uniref:Poly [ADP-ribose] polymerase n=1 Tax=Echinococcus granulosus TaxID=6210 RepID=W6U058_ECHGR|nr:Poly [ADP-ribose] polymerase [Echinococcus granulosus]EUB53851.1 Poly [ADP-ribose] polymerase [Echinococcus granulosus]
MAAVIRLSQKVFCSGTVETALSVGEINVRTSTVTLLYAIGVSLGEINSLVYADSNANQLPKGKHSVQGVGRNMPDPSTWITLDDGVVVPCGKIIESKVYTATLLYNEFIVYDVRQIRLRYLVKLRFEYIL